MRTLRMEEAICEYTFARGARQLLVAVRGVFKTRDVRAMVRGIEDFADTRQPLSIVVDYSNAKVLITPEEMNLTPKLIAEPLRILPIGVVTSRASHEMFRDHAWHAAKMGLMRGPFADRLQARNWADREQAANAARYSRIGRAVR